MGRLSKRKKRTVPAREASGVQPRWRRWILPVLIGIAALVRVLALLGFRETPYFSFLLWDERIYHEWASAIAEGAYESSSVYEFAPLPAYLFASIFKIFGANSLYIRLFNVILGTASCLGIFLLTREVLRDRSSALIAAGLAAFYGPLILFNIVPLKTSLAAFLVVGMLLVFFVAMRKKHPIAMLILGVFAGLVFGARPNAIVIFPLLMLLAIVHWLKIKIHLKRIALLGAMSLVGFTLSVAPFVIRNQVVAGEAAITTSQAGFNLYIGNNVDQVEPYYRPLPFMVTSPEKQGIQFTIEASRRLGRDLTSKEASQYWTLETLKMASSKPSAFAGRLVLKLLALISRHEAGDHYDLGFLSTKVPIFKTPFVEFWLLLPLAVIGAVRLWRNQKIRWLVFGALIYGATLVVFYSNARYRIPLAVCIMPLAAGGAGQILEYAKQKNFRELFKTGLIAGVAAGLMAIPFPGSGDETAHLNTYALILKSKNRGDEASWYWQKSVALKGSFSDYAIQSLAGDAMARGQVAKAQKYLEKIDDESFLQAQKWELLGDIHSRAGDIQKAIGAYEKSVEINSGRIGPRSKLVVLLGPVDRKKTLAAHKDLLRIKAFYKRDRVK